jgi:hypothetical protein
MKISYIPHSITPVLEISPIVILLVQPNSFPQEATDVIVSYIDPL